MPRYIDADKVMEEINRIGGHNLCEWDTLGVKALICRQDTIDVVPRAEVSRIFEELEEMLNGLKKYNPYDNMLNVVGQNFAKLKKKYTEDSTDGKRTDR